MFVGSVFLRKRVHIVIPASKCVHKDRDATKTQVETNEDHEDDEEVHPRNFICISRQISSRPKPNSLPLLLNTFQHKNMNNNNNESFEASSRV